MNDFKAYKLDADEVLRRLSSDHNGLSTAEVIKRLKIQGKNIIQSFREKTPLQVFLSQFKSFLVWLLISADVGSLFIWLKIGKQEFLFNFIVITCIVFINAFLGFFQEFQAQKHADRLRQMLKIKARVLRDSSEQEIDSSMLVVGDIIFISEGDQVPADARLIEADSLFVDESSLTGESTPVIKASKTISQDKPLGDRLNMVFGQTFVVKGRAKAIVVATGMSTQVGNIFYSINKTKEVKTPFEKEIDVVGKKIAIIIGIVIVFIAILLISHGMAFASVFIICISLAVGAIPEGLPAITTFVLALGSQRMLKNKFLIKKLSSIETLGSIDVIVTDKTGTLTQNRMSVERIFLDVHDIDLSGDKHLSALISHEAADAFLHTIILANEARVNKDATFSGDPTETAMLELGKSNGLDPKRIKQNALRLDLIPFSSDTKFSASLYSLDNDNTLFVTGAPEIVLAKCGFYQLDGKNIEFDDIQKKKILEKTEIFSRNALRVIIVARKKNLSDKIKDTQNLTFVALLGLKDPPRPEVKDAIVQARSAGIKIIMLTGDYKLTAQSIAREIGLSDRAMDASEIEKLSDQEFAKAVEETDIFSRMDPSSKLKILSVLQKNSHRVAMTGDGVNDAPALRKSDISLAMGIRGTDLAKEVSHVILLDDNFATIVRGIKEGRTIFHNLRKFINYILTANVAEVIVIFITSCFGYVPLTATQILWTNFITDVFPAMALGADPSPKNIMQEKPRGVKEKVLNQRLIGLTLGIGIQKSVIMLVVFLIGYRLWGLAVAQTLTFTWLVFSHFIRIASIRINEGINFFINKYVNLSVLFSSVLQFIILYIPAIGILFDVHLLTPEQLGFDFFWLFLGGLPLAIIITKIVNRLTADD